MVDEAEELSSGIRSRFFFQILYHKCHKPFPTQTFRFAGKIVLVNGHSFKVVDQKINFLPLSIFV